MTFTFRQAGEAKEVIPVDSGKYKATLLTVDEVAEGGFGGKGFRIWTFLADVAGTPTEVSGATGRTMTNHKDNKAFQWLTAIMGAPPTLGVPYDPIGRKCLVTVGQKEKDGNIYPRVVAVDTFAEPAQVLEGVPR